MNKFDFRKATLADLQAVSHLEELCFPEDHYPGFFFYQAKELFSETLFVAVANPEKVVGYLLAAPDSKRPNYAWILSMATHPEYRGLGVGTLLLRHCVGDLEQAGFNSLSLSVSEQNTPAKSIYQKSGFELESQRKDYLGPGKSRLIMSKQLHPKNICDPNQLLSEAETSASFSNIILTISAGSLGFLLFSQKDQPGKDSIFQPGKDLIVLIVLLALALFSSLYSCLFYSNATGAISRTHELKVAVKSLEFGNAISEYFGVYPLVCAFPLLVWHLAEHSNQVAITFWAAAINYVAFALYQASGFDLLSRMHSKKQSATLTKPERTVITSLFLVIMLSIIKAEASKDKDYTLQYVACSIFIFFCFVLSWWAIKYSEGHIKN